MDLTGPEGGSRNSMGLPPYAWRRISHAPHRLLMLDLDGTLVPFEIARDRAVPAPETLALLQRIARSGTTTLAVISGRPMRELTALLGHPSWILVAEHGWEVLVPGQRILRHEPPDGTAARLDRAERTAQDAGIGDRLERKHTSLAAHTRGLEEARARAIEATAIRSWTSLTVGTPMRLMPFRGGVELRTLGRDKGTAVKDLLARERPGTLGVYVGDDETDEDAFAALAGDGFGVRVGSPEEQSAASARLADPEEVARFVARWLEVTEENGRARA